jgi:hypothetical protein
VHLLHQRIEDAQRRRAQRLQLARIVHELGQADRPERKALVQRLLVDGPGLQPQHHPRSPAVLEGQERVEIQNTLLLTFQLALVKKPEKPKEPTEEELALKAAQDRADAAEKRAQAAEDKLKAQQATRPPATPAAPEPSASETPPPPAAPSPPPPQ